MIGVLAKWLRTSPKTNDNRADHERVPGGTYQARLACEDVDTLVAAGCKATPTNPVWPPTPSDTAVEPGCRVRRHEADGPT